MPAFSWLALFFGAFYFVYGAYLPFWSLWLEGKGVSAEQIGLLLGVGMAIRFAGNLVVMGQTNSNGGYYGTDGGAAQMQGGLHVTNDFTVNGKNVRVRTIGFSGSVTIVMMR